MNYKMMGKFISQILMVEAGFMLPALLISLFDGETNAVRGFVMAIAVAVVVSLGLYLLCRKSQNVSMPKKVWCVLV